MKQIRQSKRAYARLLSAFWVMLALCAAAALTGCSKQKSIPQSFETVTVPYQEFGKSTLFLYDGKLKVWRLDSDYMRKNLESDTAHVLAVPVRLTLFDSTGKPGTRILSDSGTTSSGLANFFIWGNVYIKTDTKMVIKTQSLWWNKTTRKVGSDAFVEIHTPEGDILRGKGLDANESFSVWSLRKSVSGEFPNFKKRIETDDFNK
jgi:LPS export ABC transporter protein LptC